MQCSLAWATLQQPYLSKSLSTSPPQNLNNWVHLVIFEPQPKIQLTRSSSKVTSFLDFQPFLQGFPSVNKYLNDLWTDVNNPTYFWLLFLPFAHVLIDPTLNDSHIEDFLTFPTCHHHPYAMSHHKDRITKQEQKEVCYMIYMDNTILQPKC